MFRRFARDRGTVGQAGSVAGRAWRNIRVFGVGRMVRSIGRLRGHNFLRADLFRNIDPDAGPTAINMLGGIGCVSIPDNFRSVRSTESVAHPLGDAFTSRLRCLYPGGTLKNPRKPPFLARQGRFEVVPSPWSRTIGGWTPGGKLFNQAAWAPQIRIAPRDHRSVSALDHGVVVAQPPMP